MEVSYVTAPPEKVGISSARLDRIAPAMQGWIDRGHENKKAIVTFPVVDTPPIEQTGREGLDAVVAGLVGGNGVDGTDNLETRFTVAKLSIMRLIALISYKL